MDTEETNVKSIFIPLKYITKELKETKAEAKEKEKKKRVETATWNVEAEQLLHMEQLTALENQEIEIEQDKGTSLIYRRKILSHIQNKLHSYKRQDIKKNRFKQDAFVTLEETCRLLISSKMVCCYCLEPVFILYEICREGKQWTLDRIDNEAGHNTGNLVISCLECNLKRRRTNKDAFMFTKNMVLMKI